MTTNEKIIDATQRVMLAIQKAAMNPDEAKVALLQHPNTIRDGWVDYFVNLLAGEDLEGEEPLPPFYAPVADARVVNLKSA